MSETKKEHFTNPFANPFAKLPGYDTTIQGDVIAFPNKPHRAPLPQRLPEPTLDFETLGELAREWAAETLIGVGAVHRTATAYLFVRAFKMLTEAGFKEFSRDAVMYLAEEMPKRYYADIVRKTSSTFRRLMRWLVATGRIERPIGEFVKWGKGKVYPKRQPITAEEYEKLKATSKHPELTWMLIVGWHTGFAGIDVATLDWSEVDMINCVVRKGRSKTREIMTNHFDSASEFGVTLRHKYNAARAAVGGRVPTGPVEPRLAIHIAPHDGPTSVWNATPSYGRTGAIRPMLEQLFQNAGIKGKGFHCFRTRWATELVNNGVNIVVAAQTTGHKSVRVLSQYVRPDPVALKAAAIIGASMSNTVMPAVSAPPDPDLDKAEVGGVYRLVGLSPRLPSGVRAKYILLTKVPAGEVEVLGFPCDVEGDPISLSEISAPRVVLRRLQTTEVPTTATQ